MITIQIQCRDINEFQKISALLGGVVHTDAAEVKPQVKAAPKKVATKAPPKAEVVLPEEEDAPLEVEETAEPEAPKAKASAPKTVTKDMVHSALQKVNTLKGIAVARATLAKFECPRISDLGADNYTEFLQACEEACT